MVKKNYDDMLSRFHLIPERQGQTDRLALSISRVSMLTRDKNGMTRSHNEITLLNFAILRVVEHFDKVPIRLLM